MTCASCQTVFDYNTGEISDHGSTNVSIGPQRTSFKFDFKQTYSDDIGKKLFIVESNQPPEPSIAALNNTIQKLLTKQEETHSEEIAVIENDVLRSFEKYLKSKLNYINFINVTIEITELHQSDKLTSIDLTDIITKNGW